MSYITSYKIPGSGNFRRLRRCLLLVVLACMPFGILRAQEAKVSVRLQEAPLSALLQEIQKQTEYKVFYSDNKVDPTRLVSVSARQVSVSRILKSILPKLGLTYQFINNTIVLSRDSKVAEPASGVMARAVPVRKAPVR